MSKSHKKTLVIVEKTIKKYRKILALADWRMSVSYLDTVNEENPNVAMDITVSISYLTAHINVFSHSYELDELSIIEAVVHELCHIITDPLYSIARANANPHLHPFIEEQREQATERMARVALQVGND